MTIKRNVVNQVTKQCPYCKGELQIDPVWIGQKLECPYCNQKFILSDSSSEPDEAQSATPVQFASNTSAATCAGDQAVGTKSILANQRRLSIVALSIASVSLIMSLIALAVCVISGTLSKSVVGTQAIAKADSTPGAGATSEVAAESSGKKAMGAKSDPKKGTRYIVPKGCRLVPSKVDNSELVLQTMPPAGVVIRASVETGDFDIGPYRMDRYWCARLCLHVTNEWKYDRNKIYAYAKKDAKVGNKLLKVFEKGQGRYCLVHIKRGYKDLTQTQYYDIVDIVEVEVK